MTARFVGRRELILVAIYLGILTFQVLWHWFLTLGCSAAQSLLGIYLYHSQKTGREVEGYLDLVLPALLMGLATGLLCRPTPFWRPVCYVLLAGLSIVAMMPFYPMFLQKGAAWWWPPTFGEFILELFKAWIATGAFAIAGGALRDPGSS